MPNHLCVLTYEFVLSTLPYFNGRDRPAVIVSEYLVRIALNLFKPTGYVMHHQFNIQQLYTLPTLYLCVLYLSENKQRLVPLTS
jgi:hypothetical protein